MQSVHDVAPGACRERAVPPVIDSPRPRAPRPCPPLTPAPPVRAAWETCKENAQPIRRGRKAEALGARLAEASAEEDQRKRDEWEGRIAADAAGGDPLQTWVDYIRWMQDTCVTGGAPAQQLLPLQKATSLEDGEPVRWLHEAIGVPGAPPVLPVASPCTKPLKRSFSYSKK